MTGYSYGPNLRVHLYAECVSKRIDDPMLVDISGLADQRVCSRCRLRHDRAWTTFAASAYAAADAAARLGAAVEAAKVRKRTRVGLRRLFASGREHPS